MPQFFSCKDCPNQDDNNPMCRNTYIAESLIANGVTVQEWISVKDRLPEFCVAVLAYAKYYVSVRYEPTVVRWTGDYWCDATGIRMQVTYWMPMPQPPKGE